MGLNWENGLKLSKMDLNLEKRTKINMGLNWENDHLVKKGCQEWEKHIIYQLQLYN